MKKKSVFLIFLAVLLIHLTISPLLAETEGKITKVEGNSATINIGQKQGLSVGLEGFVFYVISTPQTVKINVAKIKITRVFPNYAIVKILSKTETVRKNFSVSFKGKDVTPESKISISEAVICENIVDSKPSGTSTDFQIPAEIKKRLHLYLRYSDAVADKTTIQHKWYFGENLVFTSEPSILRSKENFFIGWYDNTFQEGAYRVDILADGEVVKTISFNVKLVPVKFELTEAVVCEGVVSGKPVKAGTVFQIPHGTRKGLYLFVRYRGAVPDKTTIQQKWYFENKLVGLADPYTLKFREDKFTGLNLYSSQEGIGRVDILINGEVYRSLSFTINIASAKFEITEAVMCEDVVNWKPVGISTIFSITSGTAKNLYAFIRYKGAVIKQTSIQLKWYCNGKLISETKPFILQYKDGALKSSRADNLQKGDYRLDIVINGEVQHSLNFKVTSKE